RSREARQTGMRGGLAWMDAECRRRCSKTFLAASDDERRALLDAISYVKAADEEDEEEGDTAGREPRERARGRLPHGSAFFSSFRDLTASGFWSSKVGVKDLGYVGNQPTVWAGPPPEILRKLGLETS